MIWDDGCSGIVVGSIAVLACFAVKFLITWSKKPHQGISQDHLFDLIALCAKVQYKTQDCEPQAKGKKPAYAAGIKVEGDMTREDKLRLEELGKFGISIADREWILAFIKR